MWKGNIVISLFEYGNSGISIILNVKRKHIHHKSILFELNSLVFKMVRSICLPLFQLVAPQMQVTFKALRFCFQGNTNNAKEKRIFLFIIRSSVCGVVHAPEFIDFYIFISRSLHNHNVLLCAVTNTIFCSSVCFCTICHCAFGFIWLLFVI